MSDQGQKSVHDLVPVKAGKGTWYLEKDVLSTGLPVFINYSKDFPKGYLNKTQCQSIRMPVENGEDPVAFKRNNTKGLYHPLYDRTDSDYCKKPTYPANGIPVELTRVPPYLVSHNSKRKRPEPVAYYMDGIGGTIESLYERINK